MDRIEMFSCGRKLGTDPDLSVPDLERTQTGPLSCARSLNLDGPGVYNNRTNAPPANLHHCRLIKKCKCDTIVGHSLRVLSHTTLWNLVSTVFLKFSSSKSSNYIWKVYAAQHHTKVSVADSLLF